MCETAGGIWPRKATSLLWLTLPRQGYCLLAFRSARGALGARGARGAVRPVGPWGTGARGASGGSMNPYCFRNSSRFLLRTPLLAVSYVVTVEALTCF